MFANKKLSDCLNAIGATRSDVENWLARLDLMTDYEATRPGSRRLYSRNNILELAGIAAFTKAGIPASSAVIYAHTFVCVPLSKDHRREWLAFVPEKVGRDAPEVQNVSISTNNLDAGTLIKLAEGAEGAPVFSVVRTGEVVRRVNSLFEREQ